MDGMVPLSLTRSWYATWFALTTWRIGCGRVIRQLSNRLTRFTAIVSHIGGRDELFLFLFLRHFVDQCVSRVYGTVVKGAASTFGVMACYKLSPTMGFIQGTP